MVCFLELGRKGYKIVPNRNAEKLVNINAAPKTKLERIRERVACVLITY